MIYFKKIFFLFLAIFLSYKSNESLKNRELKYKIFKEEKLLDFFLFHAENNKDSVLFIIKKKDLKSCIKPLFIIKKENLKSIEKLTSSKDTIFFYYSSFTVNDNLKIKSSTGKPNQNNQLIYSYKSYPYLINDCYHFTK